MSMADGNYKAFVGYEYKEFMADSRKASMYIDGYQCFGWELNDNQNISLEVGRTKIQLKRDRKIMNKAELTRLQRNYEDCLRQVSIMENSKASKATIVAITIGIIGTMFMAGAVFAVTASPPIIWLCVLLAIPAFAGWIMPCFCFRAMVRKRIDIVTPLIEEKYDEMYEICEKGSRLLGNPLN